MAFHDYNVLDVVQNLAGVDISADLGGLSPDDFVKFSPDGPSFETKRGCGGDVTRYATNNKMAHVEIHVMSTSAMNDRLTAIHAADLLTPNGAAVGPYVLKDKHGRTAIAAEHAWIVGWPDGVDLGKEPGTVVWKLDLALAVPFIGGH